MICPRGRMPTVCPLGERLAGSSVPVHRFGRQQRPVSTSHPTSNDSQNGHSFWRGAARGFLRRCCPACSSLSIARKPHVSVPPVEAVLVLPVHRGLRRHRDRREWPPPRTGGGDFITISGLIPRKWPLQPVAKSGSSFCTTRSYGRFS